MAVPSADFLPSARLATMVGVLGIGHVKRGETEPADIIDSEAPVAESQPKCWVPRSGRIETDLAERSSVMI